MYCVLETFAFAKAVKDLGMSDEERMDIIMAIAQNPMMGDLIPGTGGARKVRFGTERGGKSFGVRVVTYFPGEDVPVFLLDIYGKNEKLNLSMAEKNELKKVLGGIADDYRASAKAKMAKISRRA